MKIATYNINNINRRLPNLLAWLKRARPDIVCLQELKAADEAFPEADLRRAGYGAVWRGQKTWNGVAILARRSTPVLIRKALPGDPADTQSRYIEAAVEGLVIGCLYLPNGNPQPGPKFAYKLAWFRRLQDHARTLLKSGAPVVLAGDYNAVPTDFDIYSMRSWKDDALVQPETRAAYRKLVDQGFTDALRTLHPDKPMYTFWDYKRQRWERDAGLRIDHLLLSPGLKDRLTKAGVDRAVRGAEGASDHAPAWIEIRWLGSNRKLDPGRGSAILAARGNPMIELRPFEKLGKSNHGWLNANFHFSFAEYRDPKRVHWGALRVWNNDRIAPNSGFPPHPHRDMEIVTYVIKGAITHQDHLGNQGRTEAGQIQVMSAGRGIQHAEYNKENAETELFQIWILPNKEGVPARWETVQFPNDARDGKLAPLASGRGHEGAIPLHADGALYAGSLKAGQTIRQKLDGKPAYLVPARGKIEVSGGDGQPVTANARDGVAVVDQAEIELKALEDAEIVLVETDKLN